MIELLPLVRFAPADNMQFGFDSLVYPELRSQYLINTVHGKEYTLPYKSVATGAMDVVDARMPAGGFSASGLSFRINQTPVVALPATGDNVRTVNVTPLMSGDEQVLEAVYTLTDTAGKKVEETLGQLNVVAYDKQIVKLYVVPVGASTGYSENEIIQNINKIYSQAVVEWNIEWLDAFDSDAWKIDGSEVFDDTDSDDRMDYTPAMKALIRDYKDVNNNIDRQAVYVFLFNGQHRNTNLGGYMPFNKQFAFVFTGGMTTEAVAHNIAHEIAHGTFNLRHTFSNKNRYIQSPGTTQNLMDYTSTNANGLNKYQWDLIHDPERVLFSWLEDEHEAEMISISDLLTQIRNANQQEKPSVEIMQDQCPQVCYKDYTLEGEKLKYLQVNCTKEFENAPIDENMTAQLINYKLAFGEKKLVMPGEKSTVIAESISGDVVYYQFHEAKVGQAPIAAVITNNFLFEFAVLKEDKDKFEDYIYGKFLSNTIKIYITRTNTGTNSTTGTLRTDDGTIAGYTVELPRGIDNECKNSCTDNKKPFDCHCIVEGVYNFEINTKVYDAGSVKNNSLRILSAVPDGRTGVLMHGGQDDANGWSQGCILPMPNEPKKDLHYDDRHETGRNNTVEQSVDFTKELIEWVKQREAEIKKRNKNIEMVVKQIVITKTF